MSNYETKEEHVYSKILEYEKKYSNNFELGERVRDLIRGLKLK